MYIIEDLCCSYWKNYGGGLLDEYSAINFLKTLVDICNYEHWRISKPRSWLISKFAEKYGFSMDDETLSTVHSIEFYNSLCVIRKETPDKNEIGMRVIAGNECLIGDIGEFRKLNGSSISSVPAEVDGTGGLSMEHA
ncbi:MAG: hypothetical protein QW353_08060 [Candidatus Korarchaeum sp.]